MITIPADGLARIVAAGEAAYPLESCGLLVGHGEKDGVWRVTEVHDSPNLAADARHAFEVDPALRFALLHRLRHGPEAVIGLFHSHPDLRAQPSKTDLDKVIEPDLIWLITSVLDGQAVLTTAHRLVEDGSEFQQIALRTDDWTAYPSRDPTPWPGLN
ncbi:MAG: M67 family metallopeptidase [Alphaproteobacteria bacterium]